MKQFLAPILTLFAISTLGAQIDATITSWLQNTSKTGSYYKVGNSTAIDNGILAYIVKIVANNSVISIKVVLGK